MMVVTAVVAARPRSKQLSIIDLGTLGGAFSRGLGINARGQVVGLQPHRRSHGSTPSCGRTVA